MIFYHSTFVIHLQPFMDTITNRLWQVSLIMSKSTEIYLEWSIASLFLTCAVKELGDAVRKELLAQFSEALIFHH